MFAGSNFAIGLVIAILITGFLAKGPVENFFSNHATNLENQMIAIQITK